MWYCTERRDGGREKEKEGLRNGGMDGGIEKGENVLFCKLHEQFL